VEARTRAEWRKWLEKNHSKSSSIWLIIYKKNTSPSKTLDYKEAVEEALCFGWIDSKPNKRDENSYYQFFSRRNPKSNWSRVNKNKVEELIQKGLMTKAGFEMIEIAKKLGTWDALNSVEDLVIPIELEKLFTKNKLAKKNFDSFPKSAKRGILEWIQNAKKQETKIKRIEETVLLAEKNSRANSYLKK
jgi:uncharacterized protein YdeI (YjbR/CyaY-like superfamily)